MYKFSAYGLVVAFALLGGCAYGMDNSAEKARTLSSLKDFVSWARKEGVSFDAVKLNLLLEQLKFQTNHDELDYHLVELKKVDNLCITDTDHSY